MRSLQHFFLITLIRFTLITLKDAYLQILSPIATHQKTTCKRKLTPLQTSHLFLFSIGIYQAPILENSLFVARELSVFEVMRSIFLKQKFS